MPLDVVEHLANPHAGQKQHSVDLPGNQVIGEVDHGPLLLEGHLAQRGADLRDAVHFANQLGHFRSPATFEGDDLQLAKIGKG